MVLSNEGNQNNVLGYPYKLVRVVKGKKTYLVFYVWNENKDKLERIRREPPKGQDQKRWIREKTEQINRLLILGYRIQKEEKTEQAIQTERSLMQALEEIHQIRIQNKVIGETSANREKGFIRAFEIYLKAKNIDTLPVSQAQKKHIQDFVDGLQMKSVSKNSYIAKFKALFSEMEQREWIEKNPCEKIKKLKATESTSIAFEPEHLPILKKALIERSTELYIFCMFVFYTFIRPIELRRLKVGDVDLSRKKIIVSGENSKNKKTEYVLISKQFVSILTEYQFLERPKESPLFELNNNLKYSKNWYSNEFRKICDKLGLPKTYELYGWKHTGVSEHYKKTKDIVFIQRQCRHSSLDMTNNYLKGLGLFEANENLDNAPDF